MGLDMYLKHKRYISPFDMLARDRVESFDVGITLNYQGGSRSVKRFTVDDCPEFGVEISLPVGYWRKAWAIHKWFVDNCNGGVDDCREFRVPFYKIKELLETCKQVRDDHSKAEELLPDTSPANYDEWYFLDIDNTIKILSKLENVDDYYYDASW